MLLLFSCFQKGSHVEQFAVSITAEGVVGTPEQELKPASDWDLKDSDLIEVRVRVSKFSSVLPEFSPEVKLARFSSYRCGSEYTMPVSGDCTPHRCTYVSFFGADLTDDPSNVLVVRKVKLVDAD